MRWRLEVLRIHIVHLPLHLQAWQSLRRVGWSRRDIVRTWLIAERVLVDGGMIFPTMDCGGERSWWDDCLSG